jgi:hypothetical protein
MVDKFVEPKLCQSQRHDLAEFGLILALVGTMVASASFAVGDELLAAWPALASLLHL